MSDADSLKVPFSRPSISKAEENAVLEVLRSGWLTTGKYALQFEQDFSEFMNRDSEILANRKSENLESGEVISLAVNSNTSGMILAMEACGVGPGMSMKICVRPYPRLPGIDPFLVIIIASMMSLASSNSSGSMEPSASLIWLILIKAT